MLISWCLPHLQNGLDTRVQKSRKNMKERKNRVKKLRGAKKSAVTSKK